RYSYGLNISTPSPDICLCLVQGNKHRLAWLSIDRAADVPLAGGVFGEQNISCVKDPFRAIADFDLNLSIQHDHILSPRRVVPVVVVSSAGFSKKDTSRLDQF